MVQRLNTRAHNNRNSSVGLICVRLSRLKSAPKEKKKQGKYITVIRIWFGVRESCKRELDCSGTGSVTCGGGPRYREGHFS